MSESAGGTNGRRVIGWITLSIDGFSAGPGGDMSWLVAHAVDDDAAGYYAGIRSGVSTALLGRTNYEGFAGYWPPVAQDPATDPRTRELAVWLDTVEKVVFSRTLQSAEWQNSRVSSDLEGEVRALKQAPGRDLLVLNSASIITGLMAADLLDDLRITVLPSVLGDGLRFFPDGLPASSWTLIGTATLAAGGVALHYRRA